VDNAKKPESASVQAILALGLTSFEKSGERLLGLLNLQQPQSVQLAAISTLSQFNDNRVGPELTKKWPSLTPRLRSDAAAALLARADRVTALLDAFESGAVQPSSLTTTQIKFLKTHPDRAVRQRAAKVLAGPIENTRQKVVESFTSALELKGNPQHGKKLYEERCISCHRLGGEGSALGPDLVTVKNTGKEKLLVNILDPNREVRPEFVSFVVDTKEDESSIGIVVNETSATV